MNSIDKIHLIDKCRLKENDYFNSLIAQGRECLLLSQAEIERIKTECMLLLKVQAEKYTKGRVSSIRIETAQELLNSVFYVIGVALKAYPTPENAVDALKKEPVQQLYEAGQRKIRRKLNAAYVLHSRLKSNLFHTENVFYRSTAVHGIAGFFKLYTPELFAQETHITADYPTFFSVRSLTGIEFIEKYLYNIFIENSFCRCFSADNVHRLFCGFDENYAHTVMNIYEPILTAALCCVLTERPVESLDCDLNILKVLLNRKTKSDINILLFESSKVLTAELGCSSELCCYIEKSLEKISLNIEKSLKYNCLEKTVFTPGNFAEKPEIILSQSERMSDKKYTRLLNDLILCDSVDTKIKIILSEVHSIFDLQEILRDAEPPRNELYKIISSLPTAAIAALTAQYPERDFLSDERDLNIFDAIQEYKLSLPEVQKEQLEAIINRIKVEY